MSVTIQPHGAGLTWYEDDAMARAAHALRTDLGVWLVDPFDDRGALAAAAELGPPAGVIQLLSRHNRDCAAIADRLGVPHHSIPSALPDSPFSTVSVAERPWWREAALWWERERTLVVAEAVGTIPLFALGRPAGVHPHAPVGPAPRRPGRTAPRASARRPRPAARERRRPSPPRRARLLALGPAPPVPQGPGGHARRARLTRRT